MLKTVAVPDRGITYEVEPHAIDPRMWLTLAGYRTKNGAIRSFHGWDSILVGPLGVPILGIAEYFKPLTLEMFRLLMTSDKAWAYSLGASTVADVTGGAVLNASPENPWSSVVFGGAIHVSSLDTNGMHYWDGTGTLVQIPESPTFKFINTLNDYLIGFYERLGTEHYPYSFRWAAEGHDDWWIASDTIDAGEFGLHDTPDIGVAIYRLGNDIVAYKERTVVPITFIGGNEIFGRRAAVAGVGLLGPYALGQAGDRHIFMGQETFYSYTGGNVVDDSIGDAIRDLVYKELNPAIASQVRTIFLRDRLEIVWFYPSMANTTGVGCDRAVWYNLKDGTWAGPMSIEDYITFCVNFTKATEFRRDVFGTKSGKLMGYGSSFTENGEVQNRVMESGDHNMQTDAVDESGNKVFFPLSTVFQVNVVNIDVEATTGAPQARFYIGSRLDLNDPISWQGPLTIVGGPAQTIRVPVRRTGRWFRVRIECESPLEFAIQNYQFEFERVGAR